MRAIFRQESAISMNIVIPSARFWREESAVLATAQLQIPRFARDDKSKDSNCTSIITEAHR